MYDVRIVCQNGIDRRGLIEETSLDAYEIRVMRRQSRVPVVYACSQVNDHAAIRRAKSLARDGDGVEVWRGLDCVYVQGIAPVTQ